MLSHPGGADQPFYLLVPASLLWPMVILATLATVIASQALISGIFTLTAQAVHLGFLPTVRHRPYLPAAARAGSTSARSISG